MNPPSSILVVRRDNIGDLVLTTPLIQALRRRFPGARLGVLCNTYNAPVLVGHPDIDEVFAYDKGKHLPRRSRIPAYFRTARLLSHLRARPIDLAILAAPGEQPQAARLARWIRPRAVLGFGDLGRSSWLTQSVPYRDGAMLHAAEDVFRLGRPLGITGNPGPCSVAADAGAVAEVRNALRMAGVAARPLIAIHVSARRARQRWPAENFAVLMRELHRVHGAAFIVLWAPGAADDPRHPGDDHKAAHVKRLIAGSVPCLYQATRSLDGLIGAFACCDLAICADGGAMHVAAGLGLPVVALFGDSEANRWHPWGVPYELLQSASRDVAQIDVDLVLAAFDRLVRRCSGLVRTPPADIRGDVP